MAGRFDPMAGLLGPAQRTWVVTGVAGFIGSNLLEALLERGQRVVGLDNFATGHRRNLDEVRAAVGEPAWRYFRFVEGDIRQVDACRAACEGADIVLHQAALGSVPRSIEDPIASHAANVTGSLNMLCAANACGIRRFVYASSSSVYGDEPTLPKREERIGDPLSPYAATKWMNEIYADVFRRCYQMVPVGLRYFNVFGPRQDPNGAYAAVIPSWFGALARGESIPINGDGETSRDFCYIDNVVQANLRAALAPAEAVSGQAFNIAVGDRTTLNELHALILERVVRQRPEAAGSRPVYREFRAGDIRHSLADIGKAKAALGYAPTHDLRAGLDLAAHWYLNVMPAGQICTQ